MGQNKKLRMLYIDFRLQVEDEAKVHHCASLYTCLWLCEHKTVFMISSYLFTCTSKSRCTRNTNNERNRASCYSWRRSIDSSWATRHLSISVIVCGARSLCSLAKGLPLSGRTNANCIRFGMSLAYCKRKRPEPRAYFGRKTKRQCTFNGRTVTWFAYDLQIASTGVCVSWNGNFMNNAETATFPVKCTKANMPPPLSTHIFYPFSNFLCFYVSPRIDCFSRFYSVNVDGRAFWIGNRWMGKTEVDASNL